MRTLRLKMECSLAWEKGMGYGALGDFASPVWSLNHHAQGLREEKMLPMCRLRARPVCIIILDYTRKGTLAEARRSNHPSKANSV